MDLRLHRWLKVSVRLILVVAIGLVMGLDTLRAFNLSRTNFGEGPILAVVERMQRESISAAWLKGPDYTLSCYGPGYYWACDLAARLSGWHCSIMPGRLISLCCAAAIAALIGATAGLKTRSWEIGLTSSLVYLASPIVQHWVPYARVDMLAMLLTLAAYLMLGEARRGIVLPALCIAAGSLVKPTVALSALPIATHLALCRRRLDCAAFSFLVALFGAVGWGFAQRASGGYFLSAALDSNVNPMSLWRSYEFGYGFLGSPLGATAFIIIGGLFIAEPERLTRSLFCLSFVISTAISFVTVAKRGSHVNYFLEPVMLAALVVGIYGLPWLAKLNARRTALAMAALGLVLIVPTARMLKVDSRLPACPTEYDEIREWFAGEPDDVQLLADAEWVGAALAAGRTPRVNDSYIYTLLTGNGRIQSSELISEMKSGRIRWLLLDHHVEQHAERVGHNEQMWPEDVIAVMASDYELAADAGEVLIYRHRFAKTMQVGQLGRSPAVPTTAPNR